MECLTHTFPTKNHVMTADGAESVADTSSSTAVEEVVAPLTELEPEQSAAPRAHARKRSLSLFRRKSAVASPTTDKEDANAALSIVDLGTIASSLGSSPYDADPNLWLAWIPRQLQSLRACAARIGLLLSKKRIPSGEEVITI
jgi:hypothetical protein